ncbi:hypothetical protein GCM10011611_37890 [Aliidongia dinghuensis]|uniref:Uncharacterized protein n=1 Tax=Aliidongia dinghuensis TaxID=1867774 RepID=A0A8J2YVP4_9PROT|nr:hypothetical protein [Aliidongia dinghuensis]GGF28273.1 hypothetical protein GCM10011611_37890 [Aliidongia dinghuensis]
MARTFLVWRFAPLAGALLAACHTASPAPNAFYAPPNALSPGDAVSIVGTKNDPSWLNANEYIYLWGVDRKPIAEAQGHWNTPTLLTPSVFHHLDLAYRWGMQFGSVGFDLVGRPGQRLAIECEVLETDKAAQMWLVDAATGEPMTEKYVMQIRPLGGVSAAKPIFAYYN